jgi:hypothetical protein
MVGRMAIASDLKSGDRKVMRVRILHHPLMITKTFYAIYNPKTKKFKGRGNISGSRWTDEPTQTYDSRGRVEGGIKNAYTSVQEASVE